MIAPKDSIEPQPSDARLPNSRKIYVAGSLHPEIRVPFREISLASTKTISGQIEVNEPVRVYDTSGPWGDETVALNVQQGLPPLRENWIRERGDVEEINGRAVKPIDDGYLSEKHRNGNSKFEIRNSKLFISAYAWFHNGASATIPH
jgi:phosphomethylpyrimidine synthase